MPFMPSQILPCRMMPPPTPVPSVNMHRESTPSFFPGLRCIRPGLPTLASFSTTTRSPTPRGYFGAQSRPSKPGRLGGFLGGLRAVREGLGNRCTIPLSVAFRGVASRSLRIPVHMSADIRRGGRSCRRVAIVNRFQKSGGRVCTRQRAGWCRRNRLRSRMNLRSWGSTALRFSISSSYLDVRDFDCAWRDAMYMN